MPEDVVQIACKDLEAKGMADVAEVIKQSSKAGMLTVGVLKSWIFMKDRSGWSTIWLVIKAIIGML